MKTKKGFTLVELAIALVVIGLISGIGVTALVTTLAETRRAATVEKNLEIVRKGVVGLISNHPSKNMPDRKFVDNLTVEEIRENYKYVRDTAIAGNVCDVQTTTCKIAVCNDATCTGNGLAKLINNVLFSIVETGPDKTYNTHYDVTGATLGTGCSVKIDKFSKNNDDKVVFYTLTEAKALAGCNNLKPPLEVVTDIIPPLYKSKAPRDESVRIKMTDIPGVTEYKFCISNPLGNPIVATDGVFNWVRSSSVSMTNLNCDNFGYDGITYSTTTQTYAFLSADNPLLGGPTTAFSSNILIPGNYIFNVKVGYGTFPNGAVIAEKNIVLTLNDN